MFNLHPKPIKKRLVDDVQNISQTALDCACEERDLPDALIAARGDVALPQWRVNSRRCFQEGSELVDRVLWILAKAREIKGLTQLPTLQEVLSCGTLEIDKQNK